MQAICTSHPFINRFMLLIELLIRPCDSVSLEHPSPKVISLVISFPNSMIETTARWTQIQQRRTLSASITFIPLLPAFRDMMKVESKYSSFITSLGDMTKIGGCSDTVTIQDSIQIENGVNKNGFEFLLCIQCIVFQEQIMIPGSQVGSHVIQKRRGSDFSDPNPPSDLR